MPFKINPCSGYVALYHEEETANKCEESLIYVSKQQTSREKRSNLLKCEWECLIHVKYIHVCQAIMKVGVSISRCTEIPLVHPYIKIFSTAVRLRNHKITAWFD